jgi:hypothetical protein
VLPPELGLRVNYGDNWVESFYEGGHVAWLTVTEGDGITVKATAELVTEPKEYWGGETGFQSLDSGWFDAEGNPMENPPDIKPYDWVFGWVDNGTTDSVTGTINVPWFSTEVNVECHAWGAPGPLDVKSDLVQPDGVDRYSCGWDPSTEWDIQANQAVGVAYSGPDGHWVANAFRNPRYTVFPEQEYIEGWEWPDGMTIVATVAEKPECYAEGTAGYLDDNPWSTFVGMGFPEDCDIVDGDIVTLSDGVTSVTHIVQNLAITDVDKVANTVLGTADSGAMVYAWVHGFGETEMQLTVENGSWLADFGSREFDLMENMCGRSEIRDEVGNSTAVDWCIPNPTIIAHPDQEWVEGWGFDDGAEVWLTIYDGEGVQLYQGFAIAAPPDWDPDNPNAFVQFNLDFDLKSGDHLWMTDGISTKDMIVTDLMPTGVDPGGQIVHGVAAPNSEVTVEYQGEMWTVMADPDGNWSATLPTISRGPDALASQWDEDGDMTRIAFHIPNTRFTVWPGQNYLEGYEWPDDAEVLISVADKGVCSTSAVADFPEWDPSNTFFSLNFPDGCVIGTGDLITLEFGPLSLAHKVADLYITEANHITNIVSGTAVFDPEQYILHTWIHGVDGSYMQLPTQNDAWVADFGSNEFDLQPGMGGRVELVDHASNATAVEWYIPIPVIFAHPAYELIEGVGWTPGSTVTVTVDDPTNGEGVDHSATQTAGGDGWLRFQLIDFDLQPGHIITMTDDSFTQTMTVSSLRVTGFNLDAHTLYGMGDPGSEFIVADNGMPVHVDDSGNWNTAFDELTPGSWWTILQRYDDGNEMRETFRAPVPVIFAHPAYNVIEGHEWTPLAEVTITIDDPTNGIGVDYTQTAFASDNINYLYDTGVHFELAFDLKPGHIITMTDGQYTQTMVVAALQVTGFNLDAHTVYGVGDPDSDFIIADNGMPVHVDDSGNWSVIIDGLTPGSWWTILQRFDDGNEMRETFRTPMPMMIAWKNWDGIAGSEWTPGAQVTLTIDDPENGPGVDHTFIDVAVESGNLYYGEVYFDLDIELQTGYVLTMSDGNFTKTLVLSALTVTGYDFDAHTVSGTGDPGTQLLVHLGGRASEPVTVGDDHTWSVYHELLAPGIWFDAIQSDEDGDQTRDGGQAV